VDASYLSVAAAVAAAGITLFTLTRRPAGPLNRVAAALFGVLALAHAGNALLPAPAGAALWLGFTALERSERSSSSSRRLRHRPPP